jgi:hypothetical protein
VKHLCKAAILVAVFAYAWSPIVHGQHSDALKVQYPSGELSEEGETYTYSVEKEVSLLLAHAEDQVASLALTTPEGDNAYHTYQLILSLQPNSEAALAGIEKIGLIYVGLAKLAVAKGDLQKANHYTRKAMELAPGHPAVRAMVVPSKSGGNGNSGDNSEN